MLIDAQQARDLEVELFEATTVAALQDDVNEWLEDRVEEIVVGMSFEGNHDNAGTGTSSFRCYIIYTE